MKKALPIAYALTWMLVGPNLLWVLFSQRLDLTRPLNATMGLLTVIGLLGVVIRRHALRLASGSAGVLLGLMQFYLIWLFGAFTPRGGITFGLLFWGNTITGLPGSVFASAQFGALIVLSGLTAWRAADEIDRRMEAAAKPGSP